MTSLKTEIMELANAVPVKWFVLSYGKGWNVIDTTFEGNGKSIAVCETLPEARKVARALNRLDGYKYPNEDGSIE